MSNKKHTGLTRRTSGLMALEQRFMFDGAAIDTAHDQLVDATVLDTVQLVSGDVFRFDTSTSGLASAAQLAQQQVRDYLACATDAQLFELFNGGKTALDAAWAERLSNLRAAISNGTFNVNVVAMDSASQFTAVAAFAQNGPDGKPTIFINTYWFGMFDAPDATRALVEELGHAFDAYLNPGTDSAGDEGESFADSVIDGTLSQEQRSALLTQNDHGTVTVNGVAYDVEFASLNFSNAYEMVYDQDNDTASTTVTSGAIDVTERWADKEQNSHYFNASVSLGVTSLTDGTGNQNFSGNDVSGAVAVTLGGNTYYGWVSRPIKSNGIVRGFYFWTDADFTTLAAAQSDGNQDGDSSVLDNRGFLLVVDQTWFDSQISSTGVTKTINNTKDGNDGTITVANIGSSSDRVDAALNSVIPPNSPPVAANDSNTINEGGTATGNVLTNDSDPNNDTLTVTQFSVGGVTTTVSSGGSGSYTISGVGTIVISSGGQYTFTPLTDYTGSVPPVTYTVSDGNGGTATAVLSITVSPVNDAPTATPDTKTIDENTVASGTVIANDTDPDGDSLTVTGFTYLNGTSTVTGTIGSSNTITLNGVTVGTLTLNANGTYSFTPASNYSGTVPVFNYTISDGNGGTASSTLTITLSNVNNAPVANPDNSDGTLFAQAPGCLNGTAVTETQQIGNVLGNDTDSDVSINPGVTHEVTAVTSGTGNTWNGSTITGKYGVLTIGANGAYSYNVDETNADVKALLANATLSETFNYTISEIGNSPNLTASSTLRIVINGVNNAPVALDDFNGVIERSSSVTNTVNGTSTNTYGTAAGNVSTNDSDTDSATRTVTGLSTPIIYNYSTDFGSSTNAIKSYLSPTYVSKVEYTTDGTTWNTLLNSNGTNCSVSGYDSSSGFKIFLTNSTALSSYPSGGTVRITLSGTPNKDGTYTGAYSGYTTTTGRSTTITSGSSSWLEGKYGSVNLSSTGEYTYYLTSTALGAGESYEEQFTYTVTDGSCTTTAVLHITVNGTTTLTMDNEAVTTSEDTTYTSDATTNLLNGDSGFTSGGSGTTATPYVSNFTWGGSTITVGTTGDHSASGYKTISGVGTLTVNGDGSYSFTPASNYSGPVPTATYTATDGTNAAVATLSITITSTNDPSVLVADSKTILEDGSGTGNVLVNDTDSDNSLSVASYTWNNGSTTVSGSVGNPTSIILNGVTVGSLTLNTDGTYTFTPSSNWNGSVPTITYTTNTGSSSTLDITVTPVNDPPTLDLDDNGAGTGWSAAYTNQGTSVSIGDTDVVIADIDDTNIESAVIVLTNPQSGDVLNIGGSSIALTTSGTMPSGTFSNGIAYTTSNTSGVITISLSGSYSLASYQDAIKAITFSSSGTSTVDRVISVKVNDGDADSNTAYTTIDVSADNRLVTVMGTVVNEASPYVVFEVTGVQNQWLSLNLGTTGSGTGHASVGTDFLPNLEYLVGSTWTSYTGGMIQIADAGGKLLVRTAVLQDTPFESTQANYETLKLTAKNAAGTSNVTTDGTNFLADGTARIRDDGQGSIYLNGNTSFTPSTPPTYLDDDRPVTVNSIVVNEASPYAVLTISGYSGQVLNLAWTDLTAKKDANSSGALDGTDDYGPSLQYWDPTAGSSGDWVDYNSSVTMSGSSLYVRTSIINDTPYEGLETFALEVTKASSGAKVYGTVGVVDDGTGTKYPNDNPTDGVATETTSLNDDRTITVTGGLTFNEASPYATFTVSAVAGAEINLTLGTTGSGAGHADISGFTTSYSEDGGATWINYTWNGTTGNRPTVPANGAGSSLYGTVLVRVNITSEEEGGSDVYEGAETFTLTANYVTNNAITSTGTDTIVDDGTGRIDRNGDGDTSDSNEGTGGPGAGYEDDRTIDVVGGLTFNEGSRYATFTVTAIAGQTVDLILNDSTNDTASISGFTYEYSLDGGSTWSSSYAYNSNATGVTVPGSAPGTGTILVRVDIRSEEESAGVQDSADVFEGLEPFSFTARYTSNTSKTDTATDTIADDGTGKIDNDGDGGLDEGGTKETDGTDTRTLDVVGGITFNEASTYATFTVTGAVGSVVNLELGNTTSTSDQDATIANFTVQYNTGGGWVTYTWNGSTGNRPTVPAGGTFSVRVNISSEADSPYEGAETFTLKASYATNSNISDTDTDTIIDDGTGKIDNDGDGGNDEGGTKDDDRPGPITVTGASYNENSPRAVFTVNANPGQVLTLDVQNAAESGKAPTGDNEGKPNDSLDTADIYYSLDGGATWQLYTGPITAGNVSVLVAVDISNERDDVYEGEEQLKLVVTSGGQSASGYSSIFDDGTGTVTRNITPQTTNETGANDPSVTKDDDRPKPALPPETPPPAAGPVTPFEPAQPLPPAKPDVAFNSELAPIAPALKPIEPPQPLAATLTSAGGPQFVASEAAPPGLTLFAGVTDQFIQTTDAATKISLPYDAFIHSNKEAVIKLQAKQADDSPLPKWVEFDPAAGTFTVKPPKDFKGKLDLKVIARDDDGREAVAIFQMFVGEQDQNTTKPQSRTSFTEKLRMAGKRPVTLVRIADAAHKVRAG